MSDGERMRESVDAILRRLHLYYSVYVSEYTNDVSKRIQKQVENADNHIGF